jgi:lauroyl/myristoyl acyltransferase/ADP-heptose:LPS heptosyltransferase
MVFWIKTLGFIFSRLDTSLLEQIVHLLAKLFFVFPSQRKSILLSNLKYAFPEWSNSKVRRVARISTERMLEMGFFSLTYPFVGKERWRKSVQYSTETEQRLAELRRSKAPVLFLLPHFALFETLATSPNFRPFGGKKLGAIFRPNRNPKLDQWIESARNSTGLVTFSRKEGLLKAKSFLKEGHWLVILFDQNAGDRGVLDLFFDRLVSYTTLPDSLVRSTGATPVFVFPRRIKFFQSKLEIFEIPQCKESSVSTKAHRLLESILKDDYDGCPEWLWSHGKWKIHARVESRYQLLNKRKQLIIGRELSRCTNFFVRMPNWLGDVIMAIPVLLAIREGRPDVRFTLLAKSQYIPLLRKFKMGEDYLKLPALGVKYFLDFNKILKCRPENYLLFTNSIRGDIEAFISGSRQRFGLNLPNRSRPLLTHSFDATQIGQDRFSQIHQTEMWEQMVRYFGLKEQIAKEPLHLPEILRNECKIGLVPGSSNSPGKRWSPDNWISLIKELSSLNSSFNFHLYGTEQDKGITNDIFTSLSAVNVFDHAGKTSLSQLAEELASCSLVIGNDTGSMHLANMVGTKVVVLFGPTNLKKTKPYFEAQQILIESPDKSDINSLKPEIVYQKTISVM